MANLVRNYSPFLAPTTRSARPTAELRRLLGVAAHDMLEESLRKWRRVRSESSTPAVRAVGDLFIWLALGGLLTDWMARLHPPPPHRSSIRCWQSCSHEARKRLTSMRCLTSQTRSSSPRSNPSSARQVYLTRFANCIRNTVMMRRC